MSDPIVLNKYLDDVGRRIVNYYNEFVKLIPEREFTGLLPNVQGMRAHLALESEMTIGSAPMTVGSAPIDVDIQRMAAEVQVDASRTIVAVGVTPGAAAKGWRTIDLCLLKPDVCHVFGASYRDINGQKLEKPIFYSNLVGQKAEDVILVGFDYKTGNAEMKKRAEVESRIGGPYLPLRSTEGHFADTVEQELQRFHGPALPPEEVNFGGGGLSARAGLVALAADLFLSPLLGATDEEKADKSKLNSIGPDIAGRVQALQSRIDSLVSDSNNATVWANVTVTIERDPPSISQSISSLAGGVPPPLPPGSIRSVAVENVTVSANEINEKESHINLKVSHVLFGNGTTERITYSVPIAGADPYAERRELVTRILTPAGRAWLATLLFGRSDRISKTFGDHLKHVLQAEAGTTDGPVQDPTGELGFADVGGMRERVSATGSTDQIEARPFLQRDEHRSGSDVLTGHSSTPPSNSPAAQARRTENAREMRPERENRFKHWVNRFRWPHPTETREAPLLAHQRLQHQSLQGQQHVLQELGRIHQRTVTDPAHYDPARHHSVSQHQQPHNAQHLWDYHQVGHQQQVFHQQHVLHQQVHGSHHAINQPHMHGHEPNHVVQHHDHVQQAQQAENQRLDNDHQQQLQQGTEVLRQLVHDSVQWLGDHLRLHHDHQQQQQMDIQRQQDHHAVNHQVQNHQLQNHIQQQHQLQNQIQQRPCFSPNTGVRTQRGDVLFADVREGDSVLTAKGTWRKVLKVLVHDFSGTLAEMGDGVLVTADHRILQNGEWVRAGDIFKGARRYEGVVMNLSVETEPQDRENSPQSEHSYTLSNGWVAHNTVKY